MGITDLEGAANFPTDVSPSCCVPRFADLVPFSLSQLPRDELVKLVRNRFEFQPSAQLLDDEPEMVTKITNLIGQKLSQHDTVC